ncbi:hypothetical protein [Actinosynnema sp. NPDC020468]|uniref:ABC transporter substrate-binding protein n=1 Tax=Actinosynnema sp. NPDC020468 TaxID=3154488 RepID=UPI0033D2AB5D
MDKDFSTPVTSAGTRRRRRRLAVLVAVVVLVAGGAGWWAVRHFAEAATHCAGVDSASGTGYELLRGPDGECLGWTVDLDHAFGTTDAAAADVVHRIVEANREVAKSKNYVRLAVMMPMKADDSSKLDGASLRHALQGALTAQRAVNHGPRHGDQALGVQLVLANIGVDQQSWAPVVARLGALKSGEHPLVAVTGLGVSVPETRAAADKLYDDWGIPSMGAVLSADDMTTRSTAPDSRAPGLFKTSPSNHDYAKALEAEFARLGLGSGFLVRDRNDDNFVKSLGNAFIDVFGGFDLRRRQVSFTGSTTDTDQTANLFTPAVDAISREKPAVVLYAGRDADLPTFVRRLGSRTRERSDPNLVLATGMTGLIVLDQPDPTGKLLSAADLAEAGVTLLAASSTDVAAWEQGVRRPSGYPEFRALFTGEFGFPVTDMLDGYAVMHYDAVAVTAEAARKSYSETNRLPSPQDVRNNLYSFGENPPLIGASGSYRWVEEPRNDAWPVGKIVPILTYPRGAPQQDDYRTDCHLLRNPDNLDDYESLPCYPK